MINSSFPQANASLQFLNGPLVGSTVSTSKQDTRIGGDQNGNDIVLTDPSIQQYHARIYVHQGQFVIQGFNAQSIVMVNGYAVSEAILSDGDEVSLGVSGITFIWTAPQGTQSFATPRNIPTPSPNPSIPQPILATPPQTPPLSILNPVLSTGVLPTNAIALETTRYLCAAAHLDEDFREYAIKNVFEEEHRAVGESYGVDIIPVAKWCYAARQRVFYRDLLLFIDLLIVLFSYFILHDFLSSLISSSIPPIYVSLIPLLQIIPFIFSSVLLFLLIIPFLIIGSIFRSTRRPLVQIYALLFFSIGFPLLIPCFLLAWLIVVIEQTFSHGSNAEALAKGRFRPDSGNWSLEPQLEQKLRTIFHTQDGNVVVYSGYSPFAGAGVNIDGWSFAIDISKGKKELASSTPKTPETFQVSELYTEITQAIRNLGLNNVSLEDKLYVNGQVIRDNPDFLPNNFSYPKTQVDSLLMNRFKEDPLEYIRYYTCIRVTSWDGELVLSIFVRLKLAGKNLFVEADYELLAPVKEEYHEIDTIEPTLTASKLFKFALRTFTPTVLFLLSSPVRVSKYVFHDQLLARRRVRVEKSIRENPAFDYGTKTSLREVASSRYYRLYFQRLDKEMYKKIIERQVFETITHFLDVRDIDTSDLKSRQDTVLNNGVIMTGNTIQGSNVAVGEGSKQTILAGAAPAPGGASGTTTA